MLHLMCEACDTWARRLTPFFAEDVAEGVGFDDPYGPLPT